MDRSWINARQFSKEHVDGVTEFMNFVHERFDENAEILCPCRKCLNRIHGPQGQVEDHLYIYGMSSTYNRWIHHGEPLNDGINEDAHQQDDVAFNEDEDGDDGIPDMVEELYTADDQGLGQSMFAKVIEELKRELYPGCADFSRFSFVVKLLHIKSFYRISNVAFTALLKLLSSAFPACCLPTSYDEAKNFIRAMGLGYDSIHVCPNNCVLFRKEYAKNNECPVCGASRWKDSDGKKKIPDKVLRHFPLIPRLKRMFASKKTAEAAQWHKLKRQPVENELSHPADEVPLTDYEKERAACMMRNNQRLRSLGISTLVSMLSKSCPPPKGSECEDSDPEYEPQENEDTVQDDVDKASHVSKIRQNKKSKKTATMPTGGRSRTSKRVLAPEEPDLSASRFTRQKTKEMASSVELVQETTPEPNAVTTLSPLDATQPASRPNSLSPHGEVDDEGTLSGTIHQVERGKNMGKELDRISRGLCNKIRIEIPDGKTRPEAPMQAAKLASEAGIILRQHFPILPHWKGYKGDKAGLANYIGKVAGNFTMDTSSNAVQTACKDLLKSGQRQMRYRMKKLYFDGVPANEVSTTSPFTTMSNKQWSDLVQMWSNPKHKDTCAKNKENRGKVRFQQRTGSRCYIAHCHAVKQDKYKEAEPSALDFFKDCHCSKKNGFSEPVKEAIAEMEAIMAQPVEDGQEPKSATTVVSEVLTQKCPTTKFLQNVGLESAPKSSSRGGVSSRVKELEAQLEAKEKGETELRQKLDAQQEELEALKKKAEESEAASNKQHEEMESLKKSTDETNILIRRLLLVNCGQGNPIL